MFSLKFLFGISLNFAVIAGLSYKIDTREYFRMPPVYLFDDYEHCMGLHVDEALYCVVNTYIKPDSNSELYGFIKDFSANKKQHFRHDKLQRGLCMNSCWRTLQNMGNDSAKYFVKRFPMDSKLIYEFVEYFNAKEHRELYDSDINKCINVELNEKYNLSGFSSIEYCIKGNMRPPLDWLDILTAVIVLVIIVLVATSSFFDRILRNTISSSPESHYKTALSRKSHQILTLFSFRRNWNVLAAPAKPEVRDFRFIQAIRTLTIFGVIIGHCGWFATIIPSYNPIYIEDIYSDVATMFLVNGINIVQSFFFIGGFLTGNLFLQHLEKDKSPGWLLFLKAFVLRYVRFAPLLILMILAHSTWLYRFGSGPVWDKVNFAERQFCRKNWWINMLFLNNYFEVEMICLVHTWYLAADFWLSALAILVLIVINKKPAIKHWLFGFILAASAFITAYVTYTKKLEPIAIFAPENLRNNHFIANETDPNYFKDFYAPTHMNMGNYFIGVMTGVILYNLQKQKKDISKIFWCRIIFYLCIIGGLLSVMGAYFFYNFEFEKPAIWLAIAAVIFKHSWGIFFGFGVILGIYRYGWFIPNIFYYPGWRIAGRVSYSAFICHLFILKVLLPGIHEPMYLSVLNITVYIIAVFGLSMFIGFFLTLSIEMPIITLFKILLDKDKPKESTNKIAMNGNSSNLEGH